MRFRFCGELDCPDWVLAEITTISKLSSVKMKLFCNQVLSGILTDNMDYDKVRKLTADAKYEPGDMKAAVAALEFILCSAAKHGLEEDDVLSGELQQLGMPREHSTALCKVYSEKFAQLQAKLKSKSLRLNRLEAVHWRADYIVAASSTLAQPSLELQLQAGGRTEIVTLSMDKLRVLLFELKQAQKLMDNLE